MRLTKTVSIEQADWKPIERDVQGFNAATREHAVYRTAEQHGCRRINCTQHWEKVPLPPKVVRVVVEFDENAVAETLARTAARNKTGRAVEYSGLLVAKVQR